MWGKEPKSIITDQDLAMGAAIAKAVDSRYKKERKEDFDSRHKTPSLVIGSKIEHQAASIYTRTIFSKFQKELVSSNHFTKEKVEKNGTFYRYKVTSSFDPDDAFIVKLNLESKVCECDCQLFEFMGIVCRHMLLIFQVKNIFQIPSHYILQRWTKEANKELKSVEYKSSFEDEHHMSRALRSIHLCQRVSQLSYLVEKSEDIYKMIISDLDHTLKKAFGMENELLEDKEDDEMDMHHKSGESADIVEVEDCSVIVPLNIKDPHVSQTKGRKKSTEKQGPGGGIKGGLEISLARATTKRRPCQLCGGYGHNRCTCKQYNGEGSDYQDEENITEKMGRLWGALQEYQLLVLLINYGHFEVSSSRKQDHEEGLNGFHLCHNLFLLIGFGFYDRNDTPGNLLTGFGFYEPYWLIDFANACIVLHLV
ncbi:hypothetical protein SO802_020328 [Lithocarpus litseifolius]|uniref:Protein FAR1-RELATED SEQUENCE n=1 Tax=Lithocarpus litseifolius TaxID=425828 RepID=A0AAW2CE88_9ROSI